MTTNPDAVTPSNVVLVHGAWADGSSWSTVIARLQAGGHPVTAVQLPLTGLADDIAATRRTLALSDAPTILVGHSYGGMVITGAAVDAPTVQGIVYIAAYAPEEGETVLTLNERFPTPSGVAHVRPDGEGYLWFDQAAFPASFAQDVDPVQARVLAAVQKPQKATAEPAGPPAWRTLPSWYLVATDDRMIHPDLERWMAQRMGATVVEVASSHAALITHPDRVVALIEAAAGAVSSPQAGT